MLSLILLLISILVKLPNSDEEVDGQSKFIDLDTVPISLSCTDIDQRDPKVDLNVITNGPALIGNLTRLSRYNCGNFENFDPEKKKLKSNNFFNFYFDHFHNFSHSFQKKINNFLKYTDHSTHR